MKYPLAGIIVMLLFTSFKPGVREGILRCKSESGRTRFNAKLENGTDLESAEFSIDSSSYSFTMHDKSYVIFEPASQVYTICLDEDTDNPGTGKFIRFWAIPSTFKRLPRSAGGTLPYEAYTFKARMYGTEPRKGFDFNSKVIELDCTLELE